jgi:hypothetical protein
MKCKIIILDEVYCNLIGLSEKTNEMLWNKYGPYVDGHKFMPAFKLGRWDGRIRFYKITGSTYVNLLFEIIPILEDLGYELELEDRREWFEAPSLVTSDLFAEYNIFLRPHQVLACNQLLSARGGFGILPTGFGKCAEGKTPINIKVSDKLAQIIRRIENDRSIT